MHFITEIEKNLNKKSRKDMLPMQPGDVERTWADVASLQRNFGYDPQTPVEVGVRKFIEWYKNYYS
jgi:UDP-glucuronate 4-epimerase